MSNQHGVFNDGPALLVVTAKIPQELMDKLDRFSKETRRSKSQIIRMLIERALVTDLDRPTLRGDV